MYFPFFFIKQPATSKKNKIGVVQTIHTNPEKTGTICKLNNIQTLFIKQTKKPKRNQTKQHFVSIYRLLSALFKLLHAKSRIYGCLRNLTLKT